MANESLKSLHTAVIDTGHGYEEAVTDAGSSTSSNVFRIMLALHLKHHSELHALLIAGGERPDDTGSFMSTVHKAVIGIRAAVTGLAENSLESFAGGEKRLVEDYDKAIAESRDAARTSVLTRQKSELSAAITQMMAAKG